MTTKAIKTKSAKAGFRYAPEDLAPRNAVADEAVLDSYLKRNKDALNASIDKAHAEAERGKYFTLDQVVADVRTEQKRRRSRKT